MTPQNTLLNPDNSLLLLIDIQTKLIQVMPKESAENMLENSRHLIKAATLLNIPCFLSEQYPQGLGATDDSLTNELSDSVPRFEKTSFSCVAAERFMPALEKTARKHIILTGQETHVCILQTAFDLLEKGYHVYVLEDAVCSRKAEHKFYALQRMQQQGASITNFESVLFEWLKDARHAHFSTLSQLLR